LASGKKNGQNAALTDCVLCTRDVIIMAPYLQKFQYMCPIKLPIFWIFHIWKINRIKPFYNLFIGRPSYQRPPY